jgi:hypothetical protein
MVKSTHRIQVLDLERVFNFSGFISGFIGAMLSVVDDVFIDNEAPVVTS